MQPCSRHLGNYELICTLILLFPLLFCLTTQVLMIQNGITHETKPHISQKASECHLLSPTTTIHPALPEHQLLCIGLKSNSSSAAEQIYIGWLTLLCSLLCVEAYGFQGLEWKRGGKLFPCLLLIVFPTQKRKWEEILLLLKQVLGSYWERGWASKCLCSFCWGLLMVRWKKQWQRGLCNVNGCVSEQIFPSACAEKNPNPTHVFRGSQPLKSAISFLPSPGMLLVCMKMCSI